MKLKLSQQGIEYGDPFEHYKEATQNGTVPGLLMESRTLNLAYGKQSIVALNLALKLSGKGNTCRIEALTEQGEHLLEEFAPGDFPFADSYTQGSNSIELQVSRDFNPNHSEAERRRHRSAASFLRSCMAKFQTDNPFAGVYGAFAYDFVRNFEDIGNLHNKEPGNDFLLFLPGAICVFDDIRQRAVAYELLLEGKNTPLCLYEFEAGDSSAPPVESMSSSEFEQKVARIVSDIRNGRFMQCVLSRSLSFPVVQHPLQTYTRLREINPSPYCFLFNFGEGEFLYGSSPEMHAAVQDGIMQIRPLAGTRRRSANPLEDALARISLLTDAKEMSEHSMLVDLARNDVFRLCEPQSVRVTDMYTVEQYPNLYHLASGVQGKLLDGTDCIDVILTTLPAGTLSGAPKLEAMKAIEELENTRRGFYGGAVGYLTFNGACNTGITIRSIYVNGRYSTLQAGAGVVLDSVPEKEAGEVMLKLEKPLKLLRGGIE